MSSGPLLSRDLGPALVLLRKRRGLQQNEVAARARLTKAMVSAYEHGKRLPSLRSLEALLRALRVDLRHLDSALRITHSGTRTLYNGRKIPPSFRKALRELRERAGLSQEDAARRTGIRRQSWNYYESGQHAPAFPIVLAALDVLGFSLAELEETMRRVERRKH